MPGAPGKDERFQKWVRLTKRSEFLRVQESGFKVWSGLFVALALKNEIGVTRLGITVSTKVGNSVARSRLRRRLRELFRKRRADLPAGLDLVIVARPVAKEARWTELSSGFDEVARKLKR